MERVKRCIICKSLDFVPLCPVQDWTSNSKEKFLFSKCTRCSMAFLSLRPFASDIGRYYREDYQPYNAGYSPLVEFLIKRRTKNEIELFKRYKKDGLSVLEIGASFGKYLYDLKRYGYFKVTGVEINKKMCRLGRKRYK